MPADKRNEDRFFFRKSYGDRFDGLGLLPVPQYNIMVDWKEKEKELLQPRTKSPKGDHVCYDDTIHFFTPSYTNGEQLRDKSVYCSSH